MKASILDLRYHMNDVLKALKRNQSVEVLYHGKTCGEIIPKKDNHGKQKVSEHPLFGMLANAEDSVEETMQQLRGGRYNDL